MKLRNLQMDPSRDFVISMCVFVIFYGFRKVVWLLQFKRSHKTLPLKTTGKRICLWQRIYRVEFVEFVVITRELLDTGWRRLIGSPKLQFIFHKRATKYRSLLRKMTYKDKGSYESSPPCTRLRRRNYWQSGDYRLQIIACRFGLKFHCPKSILRLAL